MFKGQQRDQDLRTIAQITTDLQREFPGLTYRKLYVRIRELKRHGLIAPSKGEHNADLLCSSDVKVVRKLIELEAEGRLMPSAIELLKGGADYGALSRAQLVELLRRQNKEYATLAALVQQTTLSVWARLKRLLRRSS